VHLTITHAGTCFAGGDGIVLHHVRDGQTSWIIAVRVRPPPTRALANVVERHYGTATSLPSTSVLVGARRAVHSRRLSNDGQLKFCEEHIKTLRKLMLLY